MKTHLIISPHPDDETIGAGGTLLKQKYLGHKVGCLMVTKTNIDKDIIEQKKTIKKISKIYKFDYIEQLDFKAASLDLISKDFLVKKIRKILNSFKPDCLYLPHASDIHSDHKIIFDVVLSAAKWFRYRGIKKIFSYETLSETNVFAIDNNRFIENYFVDITKFIKKKNKVINCYKNQIAKHPFPRSIETMNALAKYRGSQCGVKFAEAFQLIFYRDL